MSKIFLKNDEIDLNSNSIVSEVTIFTNKALVKREIKIITPKGESIITFTNLGNNIISESIKAFSHSKSIEIISTNLTVNTLYLYKEKENQKIHNELLEVMKSIMLILDEQKFYNLENSIIYDLRDYIEKSLNDTLLERENSLIKLKEALTFLENKINENTQKLLSLEDNGLKLKEKMNILRLKLDEIRKLDLKKQNNIEVTIISDNENEALIEISYILINAGWIAQYDSHLNTETKTIEFSYYGSIKQSTGENWNDVKIILSTAFVESSIEIPVLYPVYLKTFYEKRDKNIIIETKDIKNLNSDSEETEEATSVENSQSESSQQNDVRVELEKKPISASFIIEKKATIPSDGKSHKVLILKKSIKPDLYYETIPELMEYVYLKSELKNNTGLPFFEGGNSIFRNGSFIGKSRLKYIAADENFSISFGIDEDVRIKRIILKNLYTPASGINLKNLYCKTFNFILNNYKKEKVIVKLKEGIYSSEISEVKVKINKETSEGYKADKDGIVEWLIDLDPDPLIFKEIILDYQIESSKSFDLGQI